MKRLQSAIVSVEITENKGDHLSLEELSDRINVSSRTLSKLWSLSVGVDRKTLKLCFSAFNLELQSQDYTDVNEVNETETSELLSVDSNTEEDSFQPSQFTSFVEEHHKQTQQTRTDRGCDRQWWHLPLSFMAILAQTAKKS